MSADEIRELAEDCRRKIVGKPFPRGHHGMCGICKRDRKWRQGAYPDAGNG